MYTKSLIVWVVDLYGWLIVHREMGVGTVWDRTGCDGMMMRTMMHMHGIGGGRDGEDWTLDPY